MILSTKTIESPGRMVPSGLPSAAVGRGHHHAYRCADLLSDQRLAEAGNHAVCTHARGRAALVRAVEDLAVAAVDPLVADVDDALVGDLVAVSSVSVRTWVSSTASGAVTLMSGP